MSRMPAHALYSFRYAFRASVFIVVTAFFSLFSPTAHADPHAVFYTDRAQEQVFFNTLAALNQADFVEPGIPGQPYNRSDLVAKREQAENILPAVSPVPNPSAPQVDRFNTENNPLITSTKTDLPAILSRNITLEGNDLWTAYLVNQFALETKTRRSVSELVRDLCTAGLGRLGCSNRPGAAQQQGTAFVNDIATYNPESLSVVGGLSTGASKEDELRDNITAKPADGATQPQNSSSGAAAPQNKPVSPQLKTARPEVAGLRTIREANNDEPEKLEIVNNLTSSVTAAYFNNSFPSDALEKVELQEDGNTKINEDVSGTEYLKIASNIGALLPAVISSAERALVLGEAARQNREHTPSLATTSVAKDTSGAVREIVKAPSTAKEELIATLANVLQNTTVNQKIADPNEIIVPGTQPALSRGQVEGISTSNSIIEQPKDGKVAGIASTYYDLFQQYFRNPNPDPEILPNNPTTGLIPPFRETGPQEGFQALTGDADYRDTQINNPEAECGFCIELSQLLGESVGSGAGNIISNATATVTGLIQQTYNDIFCLLLPNDSYCAPPTTP